MMLRFSRRNLLWFGFCSPCVMLKMSAPSRQEREMRSIKMTDGKYLINISFNATLAKETAIFH